MQRYILDGTSSSGKTSLIRALENRNYFIVEEAATAVIALEKAKGHERWSSSNFGKYIDMVIALQKQRQLQSSKLNTPIQFFDRSPISTYSLCEFRHHKPTPALLREIKRITEENIYEKNIFSIEHLSHYEPTEARHINFEQALHLEKVIEDTYEKFGYTIIKIPEASVEERVKQILDIVTYDL